MNRAVEQALTQLLPRLTTDLPPQLIELASSILAQSRHKASNLSQDEEIGRTYTCCHIACERLKSALNLPKIEPRPPVPPRVYKKLYTHLDIALAAKPQRTPKKDVKQIEAEPARREGIQKTPTQRTPVPRKQNPISTNSSQKPLPSRPTPSKAQSLAAYKTGPKHRKSELSHGGRGLEIPAWIHPMIRALCAQVEARGAAPHVLAGVTSALTLPTPRLAPAEEGKKGTIPALIAAVFILARTRLLGVETSGKEYVAMRRLILGTMKELRGDKEVCAKVEKVGGKGKVGWEGWEEVGGRDVDSWLMELSGKGWVELDWFRNIRSGAGVDVVEVGGEESEEVEEEEEEGERDEMVGGIGTMLQERVDYLSVRRREEFRVWREGVMARLEELERAKADDPMEVD